jgi:hypothetical protein
LVRNLFHRVFGVVARQGLDSVEAWQDFMRSRHGIAATETHAFIG